MPNLADTGPGWKFYHFTARARGVHINEGALAWSRACRQSHAANKASTPASQTRLYIDWTRIVRGGPELLFNFITALACSQKAPSSIAVGATAVFWSSPDTCAINSVAR